MDKEPPEILEKIDPEYRDYPEKWQTQLVDLVGAMRNVHRKALSEDRSGFNGTDVINLNRDVLMKDFMLNPHLFGRLRKQNVQIVSTIDGKKRLSSVIPADHKDLPSLFSEFSEELEERTMKIDEDSLIRDVLETAAWSHFELIRLHPFMDGNGRTARLLVDFIFARANLPYITDWGSDNREYIETVYESHQKLDKDVFKRFLARKLLSSVDDMEKEIGPLGDYVSDARVELNNYLNEDERGVSVEAL